MDNGNRICLIRLTQDLQELTPEVVQPAQLADSMSKALDGASIGLPGLASNVLMPKAKPVPMRLAWQNDSASHLAGLSASGGASGEPSSSTQHQTLEETRMKHLLTGRITRRV